ncbi:MAG: hypothetical protein ACHRXM_05550 [Isosphaerales bacterium]
MALQIDQPPTGAYAILADSVRRMAALGGAAAQSVNVADPARLNAALPHKVFVLDNDDIVKGHDLDSARLVSWRFLILDGQTPVAAVELSCDAQGQNLKFASINVGPFVAATRTAVLHAENLLQVKNGDYELRALKAPSVYVMALWLKDLRGTNDLVLPIGPANQAVAPSPQIASTLGYAATVQAPHQSSADFLNALKPSANAARSFDSAPQGPSPSPPPVP